MDMPDLGGLRHAIEISRKDLHSVKGVRTHLYRAIDAEGNILDFLLSPEADSEAAKRFFSKGHSTLHSLTSDVIRVDKNAVPMMPGANAHIDNLLDARPSQSSKLLPPILWLAFALSGIVILMGTALLYIFIPLHTPESIRRVKGNPTQVVPTATHPAALVTPIIQPTLPPTATQVSLSGSYVEQTSEVYNLTTEGTLDWIHRGLHTPTDVDRKSGVPPQISSFSLIGSGSVQRDGHYSNAYIWSDGTPVANIGQVPSGVYVTGIHNGFAIQVAASSTPRTLCVLYRR